VLFAGKSFIGLSFHSGKHIAEIVSQRTIRIGKGYPDLYVTHPEAVGILHLLDIGFDPFFNGQARVYVNVTDVDELRDIFINRCSLH